MLARIVVPSIARPCGILAVLAVFAASPLGACDGDSGQTGAQNQNHGGSGVTGNDGHAGAPSGGGGNAATGGGSVSGGGGGSSSPGSGGASSAGSGGSSGGGAGGNSGGGSGSTDAGTKTRICQAGASYGAPLSQPSVAATLVKGGFNFLEGPVWFADLGVLFFSDMDFSGGGATNVPPSLIHKLTPPSTIEDFIPMAGSNGLGIAPDGRILAATHDTQSLSKFDPATKARTNLSLTYMGKHFNSPNDVAVRSDGNIYFTDPDYQLGNRTREMTFTGVFRVSPSGALTLVDDQQQQPNGIALSVDENTLYVSNGQGAIVKYPLAADGTAGKPTSFVNASSDGMTIDCAGNLYTTDGNNSKVDIYSPAGMKIGTITVVGQPTNVAFGGADRKTLYITAGPDHSAGLYSAAINVPGYPF